MHKYPFLTPKRAVAVLRISAAVIFLSHAIVRVVNGTIPQFGGFLESKGFPIGTVIVWLITAYEIIGGLLLCFGYFVKLLTVFFILILLVGIFLIHASLGWFVGEHGTGGSEYSFILIVALLVIAAYSGKNR